jgi:hypothetical protein
MHGKHSQKLMAFKAWEGMELYHLDLAFNLEKMSALRSRAA